MIIKYEDFNRYKLMLSQISLKAKEEFMDHFKYMDFYERMKNGEDSRELQKEFENLLNSGTRQEFIDYAYALASKYGEASSALACQFFDEVAVAEGVTLPAAIPAQTATAKETAIAINGALKQTQNVEALGAVVGRLVKQAGQDTTLQNAIRYGSQFAWIPSGETCAFCLMLASNGWQNASKKTIKGGHAEHIHANCDCCFAIRNDTSTNVEGYTPEKYQKMYYSAEGNNWQEKLNSMRRELG